ncbi:MAG: SDR family NAD(P)-dependent oxidoreductase, partial [Pseudomonadota bacterium]
MATPVSLVLGLGREVGEATARRFHDAGHKVLAAGSDDDRVDEAREALPDDVSTFHGDLNTKLGLRNAITDADEAFGRIDNAVIIPRLPGEDVLTDAKEDVLEKTVSKPLSAAVQGIRLLADRMREQEPMEIGTISRVRQRGTITFVFA